MRAINIKWDIDYDDTMVLPTEVEIPEEIASDPDYANPDYEEALAEYIADWLSDTYGYCHEGFDIVK